MLGFAESFLKTMVWLIILLIVIFASLKWLEKAGQGNVIGNLATWLNDHAQPQA